MNIISGFYKRWKKYNEIQLTKKQMDFNNREITHPPSINSGNKKCTETIEK